MAKRRPDRKNRPAASAVPNRFLDAMNRHRTLSRVVLAVVFPFLLLGLLELGLRVVGRQELRFEFTLIAFPIVGFDLDPQHLGAFSAVDGQDTMVGNPSKRVAEVKVVLKGLHQPFATATSHFSALIPP